MKNCSPCWRRKRLVVPAVHDVAGEPFCDRCFTGTHARMPREKYLRHPKAEPVISHDDPVPVGNITS
jgi:hypothetical protein